MFDWLGNIFSGIGDAIGGVFDTLGQQISNVIFDTMLQWYYNSIYNAVADFFTMMGNMGADIFKLDWVKATILLFTLFGWSPCSIRRLNTKTAVRTSNQRRLMS